MHLVVAMEMDVNRREDINNSTPKEILSIVGMLPAIHLTNSSRSQINTSILQEKGGTVV